MTERAFLVEVGTEELPPAALPGLAQAFHDGLVDGLIGSEIGYSQTTFAFSPRRLAVQVRGLADRQPDRTQHRLGPAVSAAFDENGQPTRAAQGFAASCGVAVEALERAHTDKGERLAATQRIPGQDTAGLLPDIVAGALARLPAPRRMRWGDGVDAFVRPVRWLVMLFDDAVIDCTLYGVTAGRHSRGHRFHAPGPLEIERADVDYAALLETRGHVRVNDGDNSLGAHIAGAVRDEAAALGGAALGLDAGLADEVAALVEWPVPLVGHFDERFLALPPEVLTTTLQHHQRYFPVMKRSWTRRIASLLRLPLAERGSGATRRESLLPYFIAFANIDSTDPDAVRHGNERVVTPRLEDAAFFFERDRAVSLESRVDALDSVVFQRELGSLGDKRRRLTRLAQSIAARIGADAAHAQRAALLAKCDLLTGMVGEFPELQGTMGHHYALNDGEPEPVAEAIGEQYLPRHAGDGLPATPAGRALALADRLDTLAGAFATGQRPTGERDPFALRRAMIGVLRILIEDGLPLDLRTLFDEAVNGLPESMQTAELAGALHAFALERLRGWLTDGGTRPDVFAAVEAAGLDEPRDFVARVHAVEVFSALPEAAALTAANKRIANILRQAGGAAGAVDPARFQETAERSLHDALESRRASVESLIARRRYEAALRELAALRGPVDAFFDSVMVMTDDDAVRDNRLALLASMHALFGRIADIGRVQPAQEPASPSASASASGGE